MAFDIYFACQVTKPSLVSLPAAIRTDSAYIIIHVDVSRRAARLKVTKNRVFIEGLGPINSISVNGQSIDHKGAVSVVDGDQIIIGSIVMKLKIQCE